MRRTALGLCATMLLAASPVSGPDLTLSLGALPGSLTITDAGASTVTFRSAIRIETESAGSWSRVPAEMQATPSCSVRAGGTVTLDAGARMDVQPWTGFTCGTQCVSTCRMNVYVGGGTFRFAVEVAPDWHVVTSRPFTMPPTPPKGVMNPSGAPPR